MTKPIEIEIGKSTAAERRASARRGELADALRCMVETTYSRAECHRRLDLALDFIETHRPPPGGAEQYDDPHAEIARLRRALRRISGNKHAPDFVRKIARDAL